MSSDVVLETKVLVSWPLEDEKLSLSPGLGLETQSLGLGLEIKVFVLVYHRTILYALSITYRHK